MWQGTMVAALDVRFRTFRHIIAEHMPVHQVHSVNVSFRYVSVPSHNVKATGYRGRYDECRNAATKSSFRLGLSLSWRERH